MTMHVGVGGVHKAINSVKVGVGGVWKQGQSLWVGVGGVWKKVWDYINAQAITVYVQDVDGLNGPASAACMYGADGHVYTTKYGAASVDEGSWLLVGNNTDFEIYLSGTGDTPSGSSLNTWHAGNTGPAWSVSVTSGDSKLFDGTLQIRRASDQIVVSTAGLTLSAQSSL